MDKGNRNLPTEASDTISALLADVDGTLVTKEKVLTKRAIEAVQRLHERGIAFFITSGRPPRGMRMLIEPLGLKAPMAAFNGGVIVRPDLSVVDERPLPDDVVPDVINTLLTRGLDVWIYRGTDWYVRSAQVVLIRFASLQKIERTSSFGDRVADTQRLQQESNA